MRTRFERATDERGRTEGACGRHAADLAATLGDIRCLSGARRKCRQSPRAHGRLLSTIRMGGNVITRTSWCVSVASMLALIACGPQADESAQPLTPSTTTSLSASPTPRPSPSASPSPAAPTKTAANIRVCRRAAHVKVHQGDMLKQAVDGGCFLMSTGDKLAIKLLWADAVSGEGGSPTGQIGTAATAASRSSQEIQDNGTQGFIASSTAAQMLAYTDQIISLCNQAGVTGDEVAAVPPPR